ncbi:MAG: hypothetical protein J6V73_05240, partial [Spirochaetaceae bacterium]|nr:hypothetical protein [Spirochaetaceae bacterium]
NKLSIDIEFIGYVPYDESVQYAIAQRQPAATAYPDSYFSRSLQPVVQRIYAGGSGILPALQDAPEDFADIVKEFYENKAAKGQHS